jgi:hypothetical protein
LSSAIEKALQEPIASRPTWKGQLRQMII